MFSKKTSMEKSFTNLIASGTTVSGNVHFSGVIKVQGNVSGDILTHGDASSTEDGIIIDGHAEVSSDLVRAPFITIGPAKVHSKKIWCEKVLEILAGAEISNATIYYRDIKIENSAKLHECILKHLDHCSEGEQV